MRASVKQGRREDLIAAHSHKIGAEAGAAIPRGAGGERGPIREPPHPEWNSPDSGEPGLNGGRFPAELERVRQGDPEELRGVLEGALLTRGGSTRGCGRHREVVDRAVVHHEVEEANVER